MGRPAATAARLADRYFEFSLLGLVTSGYFALAGSGFLDLPAAALTGAGLLLRGLVSAGRLRFEPPAGAVTAVTLVYLAFYPIDYFLLSKDFLQATVHLVCFLAVARILTAKTDRDYVYVKIIAFLELLAAAILSTNLTFFVFLALFLLFGVATFASSEIRRGTRGKSLVSSGGLRQFHWRLAALSLFISTGVLALTAAFFFVLPRTARAAFRHFAPERYHLPGFSDEVRLGAMGEVLEQNTPVMRVRIVDENRNFHLKWRGAVLSRFDGRRWFVFSSGGNVVPVREGWAILGTDDERRRSGRHIKYEVQVKSIGTDVLFFTGVPIAVAVDSLSVLRGASGMYRLGYGTSDGLRYAGYSLLAGDAAPGEAPADREEYLQLPPLDPRIAALARQAAGSAGSDLERARAVEAYLKANYAYTTELPEREPADPLAEFLFQRRRGHCEYYASAMAVMLRSLGIPSRVVTGFQGGIFNPISGWHVIRAADAHSWVEAWVSGGWTTFDPTPGNSTPRPPSFWSKWFLYVDAAETFWQDWVVNYDLERQIFLATRMGNSGRGFGAAWMESLRAPLSEWKARITGWIAGYGPAALGVAAAGLLARRYGRKIWRIWRMRAGFRRARRGEAGIADATVLYLRMLSMFEKKGLRKPPWLTPGEFVALMPPSESAGIARELTAAYNELRFGGNLAAATRITALIEQLERAG